MEHPKQMMQFGGAPQLQTPPPPPPLLNQPNITAAGAVAGRAAAGAGGPGSTVKTGPEGTPNPSTAKTLLGA